MYLRTRLDDVIGLLAFERFDADFADYEIYVPAPSLSTDYQYNSHAKKDAIKLYGGPGDEHGDLPSSATPISQENLISGTINESGDIDYFHFTATIGQELGFYLNPIQYVAFNDITIYIEDDQGNLIYTSFANSLQTFTATETDYFIYVSSGLTDIDYKFRVFDRTQDDHGDTTAIATSVALNTTFDGVLEGAGDYDVFAFTVSAGDIINFNFSLIPGYRADPNDEFGVSDAIFFTLYDQDGEIMFGGSAAEYADYNGHQYLDSGTYYIALEAPYDSSVGNYELTIETVTDDAPDFLTTSSPHLTLNSSINGRYDHNQDIDVYQIDISAPGTFRFEISPVSNFSKHSLALFNSKGDLVAADFIYFEWNGLVVELDAADTYYIAAVLEENTADSANYTLSATQVTDDHTNYIDNGNATITLDGASVSGSLEYLEDYDIFEFDYVLGQSYYAVVTGPDAENIRVQMVAENGVIFSTISNQATQLITDQNYYIAVSGDQPTDLGDYTIEIVTYMNDHDFNDPGALTIGGSDTGNWDSDEMFRVADYFTIDVTAGQTLKFTLDTDLPDYNDGAGMSIFHSDGYFLGGGRDPITSEMIVSFAQSGTYYVVIGSGSSLDGANYTISADVQRDDFMNNSATTGQLVLGGEAATGAITYNNDEDWFALDVEAPTEVAFTFNYNRDVDARLTIYTVEHDPVTGEMLITSGESIFFYNDTETYTFTAAGTYFIEVEGNNREARGYYSLSAELTGPYFFSGDEGANSLTGTNSEDQLSGFGGNDHLQGLDGDDTLDGGTQNDILDGGTGADSMAGGTGNDIYYVDDAGDEVIELSGAGSGYDIVNTTLNVYLLDPGSNIERVNFQGTGNFLGRGDEGDNRFTGGAGNDKFLLDAGGADIFSGGLGRDSFDARSSSAGIQLHLENQSLNAGDVAGDIFASIESFFGSNTAGDYMETGAARARFNGFGGDDTLVGGSSVDFLQGGADNDDLFGNGARDILHGGTGNDDMTGGADRDQFLFVEAAFGQDIILDYEDGLDYLKVFSAVADDISDFIITGNGTSTVTLTLDDGTGNNSITLISHDGSNMTIDAADFQFY